MAATVSSLLRSRWAARSIRQRVRCAAGVSPTVARKRRASVARETPVAAASDSTVHERDLRTNYLGTLRVIRAFVPALEHNAPAAVVNALVLVALEPMGPAFLDYGRGGNRPEAPIGTQKPPSVRDKEDFCPNGRWYYPVIRVRAGGRARPAGPSDPA